ncbi:hypothetical protein [Paramuribaculum intestinale]|uniref:hypothetical protein n=1 Tax=Paramuribaculum intestinale TaxID=2094151 RepID=UPI0025B735C9|nr:hypothetical protein [Paramuribaculum intestinale]
MNRYCRYIFILLTLSFTMSANAKSKFTADIKMRNGHEYSGVEFTTPKSWDKEVAVKINGEKLKIKGDSIDHIVFWPTKYPDNPQIICWHTYGSIDNKTGEYKPNCGHNAKKGEPSKQWFAIHAAGEHVNLWSCFSSIKLTGETVYFTTTLSSPYFFQKHDGLFVHIPFTLFKSGKTREWLSTFFSDDEPLAEILSDKSQLYDRGSAAYRKGSLYTPYKYEDIVKLYVDGRKKQQP